MPTGGARVGESSPIFWNIFGSFSIFPCALVTNKISARGCGVLFEKLQNLNMDNTLCGQKPPNRWYFCRNCAPVKSIRNEFAAISQRKRNYKSFNTIIPFEFLYSRSAANNNSRISNYLVTTKNVGSVIFDASCVSNT